MLVTIGAPAVVPGVAQIQVRSLRGELNGIEIRPLTMQGPGASLAPRPDAMRLATDDPQLYTGNLWIMLRGSWKALLQVEGTQGKGALAVPLAAVSMTAARMGRGTGALLGGFGLLLAIPLVTIVRAANGQAQLEPRQSLTPSLKRRAYIGMSVGAVVILMLLVLGDLWWGLEASANSKMVYRVPHLAASLQPSGRLLVRLENPNSASADPEARDSWAQAIEMSDLVPDHGHLIHLFLISMPEMKSFWHLHPDQTSELEFAANLPALPPGHSHLYASIVPNTDLPTP